MTREKTSHYTRRMIWLAAGVIAVCVAYTGGWYYAAHRLEARASSFVGELNGGGVRAFCENSHAHGYPFRMGLSCKSVFYENAGNGMSLRSGAVEVLANIYLPSKILSDFKGPATILLPFSPPLILEWESLWASARLDGAFPRTLSAQGKTLNLMLEEKAQTPLAQVRQGQLHARVLDDDLETAVSFSGLQLGQDVAVGLPILEGRAKSLIKDGNILVKQGLRTFRGQSLVIEEAVLGLAGEKAQIAFTGPLSVDENGLLNGDLTLQIEDISALGEFAERLFPDDRETIRSARSLVASLASQSFQLRFAGGSAYIGFVPVGSIPPLP